MAEASAPATLDRAGIAARIPHAGNMCLLDALLAWTPQHILCRSHSHTSPDHPLRSAQGLHSACAFEYAAQAMALHGALVQGVGSVPRPGYLASARAVRLHRARLDDVRGALQVQAWHLAGAGQQLLYRFALHDEAGLALAEGRITVVLNARGEAQNR